MISASASTRSGARALTALKIANQVHEVTDEEIERFVTKFLEGNLPTKDPIYEACEQRFYSDLPRGEFLERLFSIFYQVALVGVKPEPHLPRQWSFQDEPLLPKGRFEETWHIEIHKTFWA